MPEDLEIFSSPSVVLSLTRFVLIEKAPMKVIIQINPKVVFYVTNCNSKEEFYSGSNNFTNRTYYSNFLSTDCKLSDFYIVIKVINAFGVEVSDSYGSLLDKDACKKVK